MKWWFFLENEFKNEILRSDWLKSINGFWRRFSPVCFWMFLNNIGHKYTWVAQNHFWLALAGSQLTQLSREICCFLIGRENFTKKRILLQVAPHEIGIFLLKIEFLTLKNVILSSDWSKLKHIPYFRFKAGSSYRKCR